MASKGDAIVLICGLGLPVILRPIDDVTGGGKYEVVRPTIVKGLMEDQVGDKSDSSDTDSPCVKELYAANYSFN